MLRIRFVAVALAALGLFASATAFASPDAGREKARFPMPAAEFKQKVDTRMAKARVRMENRAAKLPAEQAKDLRAKFDAGVVKVGEAVAKATADGTVTKDEAREVRVHAKAMKPHGRKHARHGKRGHHGKGRPGGSEAPKK